MSDLLLPHGHQQIIEIALAFDKGDLARFEGIEALEALLRPSSPLMSLPGAGSTDLFFCRAIEDRQNSQEWQGGCVTAWVLSPDKSFESGVI
jgi:hypothetical protein